MKIKYLSQFKQLIYLSVTYCTLISILHIIEGWLSVQNFQTYKKLSMVYNTLMPQFSNLQQNKYSVQKNKYGVIFSFFFQIYKINAIKLVN